jgi:hypothetical protein
MEITAERDLLDCCYGFAALELYDMARDIVADDIDPLRFGERVSTYEFDHLGPPHAYVYCNLIDAWAFARSEAERNAIMLQQRDLPLATALHIFQNNLRWARFWSIRHPQAEWRAKFAEEVKAAETQAQELEALMMKKLKDAPSTRML